MQVIDRKLKLALGSIQMSECVTRGVIIVTMQYMRRLVVRPSLSGLNDLNCRK